MTEEFLSYVWKNRLVMEPLETYNGEPVRIYDPGQCNRDSGPDFFNARVRIGSTLWAGNVEIHVVSSDWYRHGHQNDDRYNNIILHLVYEHDREVYTLPGEPVPVLEVKGRVDEKMLSRYQEFQRSRWWIPCANLIGSVNADILQDWLSQLVSERISEKSERVHKLFVMNNYHWLQTVYMTLATGFGFHVNNLPFEMLAKSLHPDMLIRHHKDLLSLEALLFGQSGLLNPSCPGEYPAILKKEYEKLRHEYILNPIDGKLWYFLRLRPRNFPTVRIAQFAMMLHKYGEYLPNLIHESSFRELYDALEVNTSKYWEDHYIFGQTSKKSSKNLGPGAINSLILNAIIPLKILHSKLHNDENSMQNAIAILKEIPAESNYIIKKFQGLGVSAVNAYQTQGLLHLKKKYCDQKKCLDCMVGKVLIG